MILLRFCKNLPSLREINVRDNWIEIDSIGQSYCRILPRLTNLKMFDFSENKIGNFQKAGAFFSALASSTIERVELNAIEDVLDSITVSMINVKHLGVSNTNLSLLHLNDIPYLFPSIESLSVNGNMLKLISFPKLPGLLNLSASKCSFQLEEIRILASFFQGSTLKSVDLSHNYIEDEGLGCLATAISKSKIEDINIKGNKINTLNNDGFHYLESLISKAPCLRRLNLSNTGLDDTGILIIMQGLKESTKVEFIDISENDFGEMGVQSMIETLSKSKTLVELKCKKAFLNRFLKNKTDKVNPEMINFNYKNAYNASYLINLLRLPIKRIDMSSNNFNYNDLLYGMNTLERMTKLEEIILPNNNLGDEGLNLLSKAIKQNQLQITKLNLSSNSFTHEGITALVDNLEKMTSLKVLNLNNNLVKDEGLISLKKFVENGLLRLKLKENEISSVGISVFLKGFFNESSLAKLDLRFNSIDDFGAEQLVFVVANTDSFAVKLSFNNLSEKWVRETKEKYDLALIQERLVI